MIGRQECKESGIEKVVMHTPRSRKLTTGRWGRTETGIEGTFRLFVLFVLFVPGPWEFLVCTGVQVRNTVGKVVAEVCTLCSG
jgi:hypothetical protein